jgi:prophage antirepressor-like protein
MSSALQLFQFEKQDVRVVIIDGEPWWVAKDVCGALGLTNVSQAMGHLDEDEKGVSSVYTPGGNQNMLCINEPGLYGLVLVSRRPEAKAFKRWIKHEVIPSIRKTGSYSVSQEPQQYVNADFVLRLRLNAGRVPYDHWTVLEQIDKESHHSGLGLVNLINKARPDISVGKKWSNHLKKQGYDTSQFMMVPNIVHPGNMHEEDVRAYSLDLLPLFLRWLHEEYQEHFVKCYLPPRKEQKRLA